MIMREKVYLRKITEADTDNIVRWRNSTDVKRNLYSQNELTSEQHLNYFHNVVERGKCVQYIIVVEDQNGVNDVGTTFIKNIDYSNNNGEFGIFIGERNARGKGYAKYAINEILKVGFEKLKLNRIYLSVMSDNVAAIQSYKHSGFIIEGKMKEAYLRENSYIDVVIMAVLKSEWKSNKF